MRPSDWLPIVFCVSSAGLSILVLSIFITSDSVLWNNGSTLVNATIINYSISTNYNKDLIMYNFSLTIKINDWNYQLFILSAHSELELNITLNKYKVGSSIMVYFNPNPGYNDYVRLDEYNQTPFIVFVSLFTSLLVITILTCGLIFLLDKFKSKIVSSDKTELLRK